MGALGLALLLFVSPECIRTFPGANQENSICPRPYETFGASLLFFISEILKEYQTQMGF